MGIKAYPFLILPVILSVIFASVLSACAAGHCRRVSEAPQAPVQNPGAQVEAPAKPSMDDRVFVYKYDGSLQCSMGKPVALETMAKELRGMTVFGQSKKRDGLMHIQVCGSITGMANVYEISATQQKKAETLGFKKWSFE